LPVGPQKLLLGQSSGILARIVEDWQMSWILNLGSGDPANIIAQSMLYGSGVPDVVGAFDRKAGKVQWKEGDRAGNYFGNAFTKVRDPQCAAVAAGLQSACTLNAVADSSGNIVLKNPLPGARGNLGQNVIELAGTWTLDSAMSKEFKISETKRLQLRLDTLNLFNHPEPSAPTLDINGDVPFGNIATKTGQRQFQLQMRLQF